MRGAVTLINNNSFPPNAGPLASQQMDMQIWRELSAWELNSFYRSCQSSLSCHGEQWVNNYALWKTEKTLKVRSQPSQPII